MPRLDQRVGAVRLEVDLGDPVRDLAARDPQVANPTGNAVAHPVRVLSAGDRVGHAPPLSRHGPSLSRRLLALSARDGVPGHDR